MKCEICKRFIIKERKLTELFKVRYEYICDNCFKKTFDLKHETYIDINIYHLYKKLDVNYNYLIDSTSIIFFKLIKYNEYIIFDEFNIKNYYLLDMIKEMLNKSYILLSFY